MIQGSHIAPWEIVDAIFGSDGIKFSAMPNFSTAVETLDGMDIASIANVYSEIIEHYFIPLIPIYAISIVSGSYKPEDCEIILSRDAPLGLREVRLSGYSLNDDEMHELFENNNLLEGVRSLFLQKLNEKWDVDRNFFKVHLPVYGLQAPEMH